MKTLTTQKTLTYLLLFCVLLLFIRIKSTESLFYGFLLWNLFLAIIPYAISQYLKKTAHKKRHFISYFFALSLWLLFLPNAPYMITDFIHLHNENSTLVWFDLFLVFIYANTGLLHAILSLHDVYTILKDRWSELIAKNLIFVFSFLCGFGIYLGRFLRLNSWDLFTNPKLILKEIISNLGENNVWLMTFGFGSFIWLLFLLFKSLNISKNQINYPSESCE